jgi:voltage-gated potassium channel
MQAMVQPERPSSQDRGFTPSGRSIRFFQLRLLASLAFVVSLAILGVAGFMAFDRESLLDALLTTISAISTVGYSPPRPLDVAGKVLALVLIVGGLFGIALVISSLTEYFIEGDVLGIWERRKMDRTIERLKDHFIISGFGRVGTEMALTLRDAGFLFLVVDPNPEAIARASQAGYLYLEADAAHDEVLLAAGIERARGLMACADSDTNNVYVTLTARSLRSDLFIVARAAHADAEPKLYKAGANRVVSPYVMAGRHMAALATRPLVADSLNVLFDGRQIDVQTLEIVVDERSGLAGKAVRDLHNSVLGGAFVLALDRDGERIQQVGPDIVVQPGDLLLVVGSDEQLQKLGTARGGEAGASGYVGA